MMLLGLDAMCYGGKEFLFVRFVVLPLLPLPII